MLHKRTEFDHETVALIVTVM